MRKPGRTLLFLAATLVAFVGLYVLSTGDVTDTVSVPAQGAAAARQASLAQAAQRSLAGAAADVPHAGGGAASPADVPDMSEADREAGFTVGRLRPMAALPMESSEDLRTMNVDYHATRAALRAYQTRKALGPLKIHTYYTVDCTYHSLWQVLALEYSWNLVGQGGFISRVISGCGSPGDTKTKDWKRSVLPKAIEETRFGAYFAPTFSVLPSGKYYAPYNRPNAIWFWLNHTDLTEDIFILLDPDMAFMAKLVVADVKVGHPVAQFYGYMAGIKYGEYACPMCPSAEQIQRLGGDMKFAVGPPWMMHVDDLRTMMASWVAIVSVIYERDPKMWISEMVAYSVAAGFHNLPHELIYDGMVDNAGQDRAWITVADRIAPQMALIHYCFTWEVGELVKEGGGGEQMDRMMAREVQRQMPVVDYYHWSKYRMPTDWPGGKHFAPHFLLSCNCPLMQEFHTANALPDGGHAQHYRRTMVFLRTYLPLLNEVLTVWKLDVLKCHVPTAHEERQLEEAVRQGKDPFLYKTDERFSKIINLAPQVRTAHPAYWISKYVIDATSSDLTNVTFRPASEYRKEMFARLRQGQRPDKIPWPPQL